MFMSKECVTTAHEKAATSAESSTKSLPTSYVSLRYHTSASVGNAYTTTWKI